MSERRGWPTLPSDVWFDTLETVQLWTQVIGKIRMVQSPWINHSWSVTLYVSPHGLRTSLVPYDSEGFEWSFDFVEHHVDLTTTRGHHRTIPLAPMTVANFYAMVLDAMDAVSMPVTINPVPNEVADAIPFHDDTVHAAYRPDEIHAWWRAPSCSRPASSPDSEPVTGARPVPSTSSGAASILPSHASLDGRRRRTPAACPTFPMTSLARRTPTR